MNLVMIRNQRIRRGPATIWVGLEILMLVLIASPAHAQIDSSNSTPSTNASPAAFPESLAAYKKMSLVELMNLDVTSVSKEPEPYGQAPAAIEVITQDQIRRSGASSIPEALRLADNLAVAQKNSHDWGISARGFNTDLANKLLVLMDGRTLYTPLFSGVFWDVQDYLLEDIDRIEVISGPGGTLWGANAVNGVINITTKSAKDTQGVFAEAGGGTWLQDFVGLRYGGTLSSNVFFRVYGKYFDRGDQVFANGDDASDSWRMGRGGFRLDVEASPQNTFTLQGDLYSGDENVATGGNTRVSGGNVLGRWSHTFSEDSDMSLQMYYDRTHLDKASVANPFAPAGNITDDLDTYDVDFQHRFSLGGRNHVIWGLGYRFTHDVVDPAPTLTFLPTHLEHHLFSGFVQDEVRILDNLFFTLGTKLEHNDYTGLEVEPSARLKWNVTDKQMLWGAVSRAVRTPSRIDRDLVEPTYLPQPFPQSFLRGDSDFVSETLIAYELGYRAQLHPKVSVSLSTFYNDYDHIRSASTTKTTFFPFFFENNVEGETYGGEFGINYQVLDWWRLHAAYNLLKEDLRVKSGKSDINDALNETADPQHQFSLRSSMDLPHRVELDAALRWVDTLHNNRGSTVGTVPSYFELDVRLGWHPTDRLELSIVGQNLLHDQHPEYGFPDSTREEITRSVYGKVTWRW